MADAVPPEAKKVQYTMSIVMARSTFLAGFAYYEIGRFGFARGYDLSYPILMLFCFCLSVVAVCLACFVSFYVERSKTRESKKLFVARVNDTFARWAYACFLFALIFYVVAFGRIGYVYYGNSPNRFMPLAILYTTIALFIAGLAYVIRAQWLFWDRAENSVFGYAEDKRIDSEVFVREQEERAREEQPVFATQIFRKEETLEQYVLNQSNIMSGRAVYVAGFCNAGIARYLTNDYEAGTAYLFFMCMASALAIISSFLLSNICVFLNYTDDAKQRALAIMFLPIMRRLSRVYFASFFSLAVAIALMGWGCGYPDQAWITALCGAIGFALLTLSALFAHHRKVMAENLPATTAESDSAVKEVVAFTMVQLQNIGSQATLTSGFVFYNIATFATDVQPLTAPRILKDIFLAVNAATVMFGVIAAMLDSLLVVTSNSLQTTAQRAYFLQKSQIIISACINSFQVSLLGFFAGFALYGVVKYDPMSYVPLALTLFAIACIIVVNIFFAKHSNAARTEFNDYSDFPLADRRISNAAERANRGKQGSAQESSQLPRSSQHLSRRVESEKDQPKEGDTRDSSSSSETEDGGHDRALSEVEARTRHAAYQIEQQPALLNMLAGRALFFGGFAYFSINFFFTPTREVATAYLVFMSMAFSSSIAIVMLSTFYCIYLAHCPLPEMKANFVLRTRFFFRLTVTLAVVSVFSFLIAFAMIGYVKTIPNYRDIAPVMVTGTVIAAVLIVAGFWYLFLRFSNVSRLSPSARSPERYDYNRYLSQINVAASGASFVAGNVFFEILFSIAGAQADWINYYYFIMATATFVCGSFVVAMAAGVQFLLGLITLEEHRVYYAHSIRRVKAATFFMNALCFIFWLGGIIAGGRVKYDVTHGSLWQPSFSIGLTFFTAMAASALSIKLISNSVLWSTADANSPTSQLSKPLLS
jgi:hypothetical protein